MTITQNGLNGREEERITGCFGGAKFAVSPYNRNKPTTEQHGEERKEGKEPAKLKIVSLTADRHTDQP